MKRFIVLAILVVSTSAHADCIRQTLGLGTQPTWICKSALDLEDPASSGTLVLLREDGRFEAYLPSGQIFVSLTTAGNSWAQLAAPPTPVIDTANPTGD